MKGLYYKILLTGAVTFTILSCQSKQDIDNLPLPETDYDTFYATIDELGTKVYADENQKILWDGDDLISIFNKKTAPDQYRFSGPKGSNSGTFVKVPQEGIASGNDLNLIYAVYPYSENTTINNDGVITLNLPAEQHFRDKTFGPGTNTMVSVTDNNKLRFKNTVGYIVLKLYGSGVHVKSITLSGNNHEKLAGRATVSMDLGGLPVLAMDESATESVNLVCNNSPVICGISESDCTEFWFAIPPVTFSNGFTITITNFDGAVYTASNSRYLAIERNSIYRMEALEVTPDYSQFTFHDFMTSDGSRPAMITFNQSWWGEVHSAYIKYYEVDGIRYCKTFDEEGDLSGSATPGPGFWGNNGDVHLNFVWNASTNYIDIPEQSIGWEYDAGYWVKIYDTYNYYNIINSTYAGSWPTADDFYNANPSMLEKRSYYDGNGGFYLYVEWYYMIGLGGWHPATFDIVGVAEGYTR